MTSEYIQNKLEDLQSHIQGFLKVTPGYLQSDTQGTHNVTTDYSQWPCKYLKNILRVPSHWPQSNYKIDPGYPQSEPARCTIKVTLRYPQSDNLVPLKFQITTIKL